MDYSYSYNAGGGAAGLFFAVVIWIAFTVLTIVGLWKTLSKAGLPGGRRSSPSTTSTTS